MTREQYIAAWTDSYLRACGDADGADRDADQILETFIDWSPGTVVEVDRGVVRERDPQPRPAPAKPASAGCATDIRRARAPRPVLGARARRRPVRRANPAVDPGRSEKGARTMTESTAGKPALTATCGATRV